MESNKQKRAVIFLLDQTFGVLRLDESKRVTSLYGIDIMAQTKKTLDQFRKLEITTILLLPEPLSPKLLQVLKQFLPSVNEIIPIKGDLNKALSYCTENFSITPKHTVFVAADRILRDVASRHGYQVVSHPSLASLVVRGCTLKFVKVIGDRHTFERIPDIIPYYKEYVENRSLILFAVMSQKAIAKIIEHHLQVDVLPLEITTEDPLFVHLDDVDEQAVMELQNQKILFSDTRRLLVAIGPSKHNDSLSLYKRHGSLELLTPCPTLLSADPSPYIYKDSTQLILKQWPVEKVKIEYIPIELPVLDIFPLLKPSTSVSFQTDVDRFRGASDLDSSGPIISRHIRHPDNARTVQALINELTEMGYCTYTHSFSHNGMILKNVIADLPGIGYFFLKPDLLEAIRKIFLKYPYIIPHEVWIKEIIHLLGKEWFKKLELHNLSPVDVRIFLEDLFHLKPWYPWWRRVCYKPGIGAKIIIVGGHLDSTANFEAGYNPTTDPAPGADDNATGMAAVLAIARYLQRYKGKLRHTVRFCFFNAEESGLVGSKAYAELMKSIRAPIKAVICTDMMGYNSDDALIFEVHAGYTDAAIRDLSVPIAESIASWADYLGRLAPAQIYKGTSYSSYYAPDRDLYDGAINRSDHAAFHQQGYPAVAVTEDFFVNLLSEPDADPNPNYHRASDTNIDSAYGADITCAVALAVKELARG